MSNTGTESRKRPSPFSDMMLKKEVKTMCEENRPDYLYNPEKCPCPRGEQAGCVRYRKCAACIENHHNSERSPLTACEKKAVQEGWKL